MIFFINIEMYLRFNGLVSQFERGCKLLSIENGNVTQITISELAKVRDLKVGWLYERSRRDALPGQRRYGRLIKVDLAEFDAGVKEGMLS